LRSSANCQPHLRSALGAPSRRTTTRCAPETTGRTHVGPIPCAPKGRPGMLDAVRRRLP
jgi:hypothetical protein